MTISLEELEAELLVLLNHVAPNGGTAHIESVRKAFLWWRNYDGFPQHQGLLKLASEFYVDAYVFTPRNPGFFPTRNALMELLASRMGYETRVADVPHDIWETLAEDIQRFIAEVSETQT